MKIACNLRAPGAAVDALSESPNYFAWMKDAQDPADGPCRGVQQG